MSFLFLFRQFFLPINSAVKYLMFYMIDMMRFKCQLSYFTLNAV